MDNNKVYALNNLIFCIYNTADFEKMKKSVLTSICTLIPVECASFLMADDTSQNKFLRDPVCWPEKYLEMEKRYLLVEAHDYSRWLMQKSTSSVINASTLMPDEAREKTELYRSCFAPFRLHYAVDVVIASEGTFLGILSLYRKKGQEDFNEEDLILLQMLAEHLNVRFLAEKTGAGVESSSGGVSRYVAEYGLTGREDEILQMVFNGKDNREISATLCISENTLKKHLQNLYRKTGVGNRMQLMGLQMKQRWITDGASAAQNGSK